MLIIYNYRKYLYQISTNPLDQPALCMRNVLRRLLFHFFPNYLYACKYVITSYTLDIVILHLQYLDQIYSHIIMYITLEID